jgi:serine/threonine protein kinase
MKATVKRNHDPHPDSAAVDLTSQESQLAMVVEAYLAALEAGQQPDRAEFLARHPEIATELEKCLEGLELVHRVGPQLSSATGSPNIAAADLTTTTTLGDFRILREIGRGGMGVVYEAEQVSLGRRVALKVLPFAAMLDRQQLARFKNEARAAATLDHPNIVAIYSVGVERSVHFYAMQLIEGQSLAQVVEQLRKAQDAGCSMLDAGSNNRSSHEHPASSIQTPASSIDTAPIAHLTTLPDFNSKEYYRSVAMLGIQAAEALDHAHQNGIFHRDIKPANLLVECSGAGVASSFQHPASDIQHLKLWITDFGLARMEQDAGMTMTGDILGTLRYMSPEQALAKRVVVDHRSDIYSLGVTLYELLTLQPAYSGNDRHELLRQIAFDDPRPLRQINSHIPVDLETTILKAIEKNPADRYATAQLFADDLRQFLDNKPIKAKPPTWRDRAAKWSRRHPAVVWAASLFLLAATLVSAGSAILISRAYQREAAEREKAVANARRAEQVTDFLVNAFRSPAPDRDGRTVTIAEVLDRSVRELQNQLADDPHTKVELLDAIGRVYFDLGIGSESMPIWEHILDLRRRTSGPEHIDTLNAMDMLARAYGLAERRDDATKLHEELLGICKTNYGSDSQDALKMMCAVAVDYMGSGRLDEALPLLEELLQLAKARLGTKNTTTVLAMIRLGFGYMFSGRYEEALPLLEEGFELSKSVNGAKHPFTFDAMDNLALCYAYTKRLDEFISLNESLLQLRKECLGPDHPIVLKDLGELAHNYFGVDRPDDGMALYDELYKLNSGRFGAAHPTTLEVKLESALHFKDEGDYDKALHLLEEADKLFNANLGAEDPLRIRAANERLAVRGHAMARAGLTDQAAEEFIRLIDRSPDDKFRVELARWDDVFEQVVKLRPQEPSLWIGRARHRVLLSQWAEAAADYAGVIDSRPIQDETVEYAYLLLLLNDVPAYQDFCERLISRLGEPENAHVAYIMARVCAAGLCDSVDPTRLVKWANTTDGWRLHVLGLAHYRAGQYDEAVKWSNKALQHAPSRRAQCWLVMAMAHQQLGHTDEARKCLNTARRMIALEPQMITLDPNSPDFLSEPIPPFDIPPVDWIAIQLFSREAAALIENQTIEAPPAATNGLTNP